MAAVCVSAVFASVDQIAEWKIGDCLVLLALVGEGALLDIFHIVADGVCHDGVEVGVASEELGGEAACHAEHV